MSVIRIDLWSFVIHSFSADTGVSEVERAKQGKALCAFQTRLDLS